MDWRSLLFLVLFSQHLLELCFTLNDEGMALLRIKEMVEKDPYSSLENWGVDGDESDDSSPCSWFGISCENKRVVSLNLEDLRLKGVLSPELGKLVHLRCLNLHNNSFYGNIPLEIHDLQNIKYLDLGYNDFSASFLSDISRFISLDILVLSQKQLLGTFSNQPAGTDISSKIQVNDDILTLDGKSFTRSFGDTTIRKLLQGESGIQKSSSKKYMPMLLPKVSAPKVFYMRAIHSSSPPHEQFAPTILPSLDPTVAVDSPMISFKKRSPLLIPLIASGVVLLVIVAFCIIYFRSAKATSVRPWVTGLSGQLQKAFVKGVPQVMFSEIQIACEDFSNIIGSSSSCMIYKGTLSSGVEIAVTSVIPNLSKDWARQSEARFQKKIKTLSKLNHKNFVNLLGYCAEDTPFARMMVFEYAPNGTLHDHLHNKEAMDLNWPARMRIAMGIAYCIDHMFQLDPPIFPSILNSNSILLTDDCSAKISDTELLDNTITCAGNSGPLISKNLNKEDTIYQYGMLLLEIVTGKYPSSEIDGELLMWASDYLVGRKPLTDMIDPMLKNQIEGEDFTQLCRVITFCLNPDPKQRPSARDLATLLREITAISPEAAAPKLSPLWWAELEIISNDEEI